MGFAKFERVQLCITSGGCKDKCYFSVCDARNCYGSIFNPTGTNPARGSLELLMDAT